MKNKTIAIFNTEFQIDAFLSVYPELELEKTAHIHEELLKKINDTILRLKTEPARMITGKRTDEAFVTVANEYNKDDTRYIYAVTEEFVRKGFISKVVPNSIKSLLVYISNELNTEQRKALIGELVNIPDDTEEEAMKDFEKIIADIAKLNKTNF